MFERHELEYWTQFYERESESLTEKAQEVENCIEKKQEGTGKGGE